MRVDPKEQKLFLEALEKGIVLFNQKKFQEAYEIWQERWQEETTDGADLLQGLLQISVGFSKLQEGSPQSTIKLLEQGLEKLMLYPKISYNINIDVIIQTVQTYIKTAQDMISHEESKLKSPH